MKQINVTVSGPQGKGRIQLATIGEDSAVEEVFWEGDCYAARKLASTIFICVSALESESEGYPRHD